ncbi:MAG: glycosyltransferase family 4 protein [Acidobacteriota bacterium]
MKILVAAASFATNISGVQRHALNLVRCLLARPEIRSVFIVVAPWQEALINAAALPPDPRLTTWVAQMERHSAPRNVWYYRDLPQLARKLQADLVHLTCPMPVNSAAYPCPTVVTLHDLYPCEIPMNFGFPKFIFNRIVLQQCLQSADAIACVSRATQMRLEQYFPGASRRGVRIYNCVEPNEMAGPAVPLSGWRGAPFLLSIAQHRRNKNLPLLVRTYDRLLRTGQISAATELIIVGIAGPETSLLHRLVQEHRLQSRVHFLEGLSEAELHWCYRQCEALVAPSITEGFGLPVAEGLLIGCRIICSDIPAHREIGGDRCTLVRLGDRAEEDLADAIRAALQRPRPEPIELPQFTAPVLGEQYAGLYRDLIAASAKRSAAAPAMVLSAAERRLP